jgi:hypothetical protein
MSLSNYLYIENGTALNRSWNPFIVQGSISGQHNYLTSTLQKLPTTPHLYKHLNNYRTSNQLDSTQKLRRASIPLRLSSYSLENLTATTITLTLSYTKILLSSKTLCQCHRARNREVVLYIEFYLQIFIVQIRETAKLRSSEKL